MRITPVDQTTFYLDDGAYGTFRLVDPLHRIVEAETPSALFTLKGVGFGGGRGELYTGLASEPMVVMRGMHRRASTVTFPDGSVFHWQRRTWLAYRWRDAAGHTLIDYALHKGERPSASLTLHTGDLPPRTRDALIVLGWMAVLTYVFA